MEDISRFDNDPRVAFLITEYRKIEERLREIDVLKNDEEMKVLVEEEKKELEEQSKGIYDQIISIVEKGNDDQSDAPIKEIVLEVRAGAGGDEASLFAKELFEMYRRFVEMKGWEWSVIDIAENAASGYKEAGVRIIGKGAYDFLKHEAGVHRIQRVPVTERSGRIHTSTASVAVLPIVKQADISVDPSVCTMEFSRSGGAGGQNVNKVETAVRIIHNPTGIEVRSTKERSQQRNREIAMAILDAKVREFENNASAEDTAGKRREQIGTADRSEKIRTYNIPQDRITDHRVKKSWGDVDKVLSGNIEHIMAYLQEHEAEEGDESENKDGGD